jgi:hypothetical protein
LLAGLRRARSNDPAAGDGREIYERQVRAAKVDLAKVAAHHVVQSVFETCDVGGRIYGFDYQCDEMKTLTNGRAKWVVGWGRFAARATGESATYTFGALHLGDHNLFAGVREYLGEEAYRLLVQETSRAFERFDVAGLVRLLDRHFGGATYSIKSLFRDEQRRVVEKILDGTLRDLEEQYRGQYERNASMMEFLAELGMPQPRALLMAAEFTINTRLRRELERESPDVAQIDRLLAAAARERIALDGPGLAHALENTLSRLARRLTKSPEDYALLGRIRDDVALVARLPFHVNLWELQNAYYRVWRALYRDTPPPEKESAKSEESRNRLMSLGEDLSFRLE